MKDISPLTLAMIDSLVKSSQDSYPSRPHRVQQPSFELIDPNSTNVDDMLQEGKRRKRGPKVAAEEVDKSEVSLTKSFLNILNGTDKDSIERLAFEVDPSQSHTYASVFYTKLRLIPDHILKRIAIQDDLVATIVNTRSAQVQSFGRPQPDRFSQGFKIVPDKAVLAKMTGDEKIALNERIVKLEKRILTCGSTAGVKRQALCTFPQYLGMSARNAVTVGRLSTELVYVQDSQTGDRKFHSFRATDAGTIYQAAPQKEAAQAVRDEARHLIEQVKNKKFEPERFEADEYAWVQVVNGKPVQAFTEDEMVVHNFYPVTDIELGGYPVTPIDTCIAAVTTHINITTHNRLFFQSGRAARGMLVIKSDDVGEDTITRIKHQFQASVNNVSNCLTGDTQIITDQGSCTIEGFLGGRETRMMRVWTGTEFCEAMAYRTDKKKVSQTKLGNGLSLKTSPNHRFWAIGDDGEAAWKEQKDLRLGDFVAVNKAEISNPDLIPSLNGIKLDKDMMEVLGWMTGDGSLGDRSVRFYYHHEKERDVWARHHNVLRRFGIESTHEEHVISEDEKEYLREKYGFKTIADTCISNGVNSTEFSRQLFALGFTPSARGVDGIGKSIPSFLYVLPAPLKYAFLRGFFSADGNNAKGRSPAITICNHSLREQTKLLLMSVGIRTSLSEGKRKNGFDGSDRVAIECPSVLRIKDRALFFEKIGFIQAHKQPRPLTTGTNKGWGTSSAISRQTVLKYLRLVKDQTKLPHGGRHDHNLISVFSVGDHKNIDAILRNEDTCSLPRLLNYMQRAGVQAPSWMVDFNYEPVVGLTASDELVQMFDTTVYDKGHECSGATCKSNKHSLITNGIYTHQSWRMPVFAVGATDDLTWQPIDAQGGRDMEFQYLSDTNARVVMSAFQISPEELPGYQHLSRGTNNQALSESNNEYKLEAARDVGIRPLLAQFEDFLNARIVPLMDPQLAKFCVLKFVGLDAETPEKEAVRLQEGQGAYMTYDDVLQAVEKEPVGPQWGGQLPLNAIFSEKLDAHFTVGEIEEHFCGRKGASQDPALAYRRDPFWFQQQQMMMQQQQMQMEQQQAAMGQAPAGSGPPGEGGPPPEGGGEDQPPQQDPNAQQGQGDIATGLDQVIQSMSKSEGQLPPSRRRLLRQQRTTVDRLMDQMGKDLVLLNEGILDEASKHTKKSEYSWLFE